MNTPFRFELLSPADAQAIVAWRYPGLYAVYNHADVSNPAATAQAIAELLDRRSPYYAVRDAGGELIGYFAFGTAAEVGGDDEPHLLDADGTLSVGLGLRPDLTGNGQGLEFVQAGLAFAEQCFAPTAYRLFVLTFNQRARRVYERAGFAPAGLVRTQHAGIEQEFLEMRRRTAGSAAGASEHAKGDA